MKTEKEEAIEHAKALFDVGGFREANAILKPWKLSWEKLHWHFLSESEKPRQKQPQSLIVLRYDGWPSTEDQKTFILHQSDQAAADHGKKFYGYGNFRIVKFSNFIKTKQGRYLQRKFAILQKLRQFRKDK